MAEFDIDSGLWHSLSGSSTRIPSLNSYVYYFPQGHIKKSYEIRGVKDVFNSPPILCKVYCVRHLIKCSPLQVFVKYILYPIHRVKMSNNGSGNYRIMGQNDIVGFSKILTASGEGFREDRLPKGIEYANRRMAFEVVYYPIMGMPDFVVSAEKVEESMRVEWKVGMRVKMAAKTEDSSRMSWSQGIIENVGGVVENGSPWGMIQVAWDEPETLRIPKRVSPWQIECAEPPEEEHLSPFPPLSKKPKAPIMAEFDIDSGLWHSLSGSSTRIPSLNSYVYYFPQGHIKKSREIRGMKDVFNSPPILCKVYCVRHLIKCSPLQAFVKYILYPIHRVKMSNNGSGNYRIMDQKDIVCFSKILTASGEGFREDRLPEGIEYANRWMAFEVVYYPRMGMPDFVVSAEKVEESMRVEWKVGMRVKMVAKTEDLSRMSWSQGIIEKVGCVEETGSPWGMIQVAWDKPEILQFPNGVSPWQIECAEPPEEEHPSQFPPLSKKPKAPIMLPNEEVDFSLPDLTQSNSCHNSEMPFSVSMQRDSLDPTLAVSNSHHKNPDGSFTQLLENGQDTKPRHVSSVLNLGSSENTVATYSFQLFGQTIQVSRQEGTENNNVVSCGNGERRVRD